MIEIWRYDGDQVMQRVSSDDLAREAGIAPDHAKALLRVLHDRRLLFGRFVDQERQP